MRMDSYLLEQWSLWGLKGGPRDGGCTEGTLTAAESMLWSPPAESHLGGQAQQSGADGWRFQTQNAMVFAPRITMATGASQRTCHDALPGPVSAGQEEREPVWLGAEGRGPQGGQRGLGAASRLYVGHLPAHTSLGPIIEQTGQRQREKRRGLAHLDRGGEGYYQSRVQRQDRQQRLFPGVRQP